MFSPVNAVGPLFKIIWGPYHILPPLCHQSLWATVISCQENWSCLPGGPAAPILVPLQSLLNRGANDSVKILISHLGFLLRVLQWLPDSLTVKTRVLQIPYKVQWCGCLLLQPHLSPLALTDSALASLAPWRCLQQLRHTPSSGSLPLAALPSRMFFLHLLLVDFITFFRICSLSQGSSVTSLQRIATPPHPSWQALFFSVVLFTVFHQMHHFLYFFIFLFPC